MENYALQSTAESAKERGKRERSELIDRLRSEDASDLADKLSVCGAPLHLVCVCCGNKKKVETQCRRRWCPACAYAVKMDRLERFGKAARAMKWPLFVTLTVPNSVDPQCIRDLREQWSKMRRRKLIAEKISGGVSTIEVANTGNGWHPHLHIICNCKWLALHVPPPEYRDSVDVKRQKYDHARLELSAVWSNVIKQPQAIVLAVRKAPGEALAYALKYAVKGQDLIDCKEPIAPLIRVLSKSRMISTFGDMHGKIELDLEDERPAIVCTECGNEKSFVPADIIAICVRQAFDKHNCR